LTDITAAQKDIKIIMDQVMVVANHHPELNELMRHTVSDAPTWAHANMYFEAILGSFDQESEKLALLLSDYEINYGKDLKSSKIKKLVAEQDEQFKILANGYETYKIEKSNEDKRK
jgi:hypothetical protein